MKKVIITIPVYKKEMSEFEKISLVQCCKILKKYQFSLICPENLDLKEYENILNKYNINYKFKKFENKFFKGIKEYNHLMLDLNFYKQFQEYDFMLVYQLDAYVFKDELEYWCKKDFDYIGAPWFENHNFSNKESKLINPSGNGGFSLRKIKSFMEVLDCRDEKKIFIKEFLKDGLYEDVFFSQFAKKIKDDFTVAPVEEAMKFSFECQPERLYEMIGETLPFGCHAWERYEFDFWEKFIDLKEVNFEWENKSNLKNLAILRNSINSCSGEAKGLRKELNKKEILINEFTENLNNYKKNSKLKERKITELSEDLNKKEKKLDKIKILLDKNEELLNSAKAVLVEKEQEINSVYISREWYAIMKIRKLFKSFFPNESLRRKFLFFSFKFIKRTIRIIFRIKRKIFTKYFLCKKYLIKFKPRKKRKINLKSKKLVYVGHSYHNKTKSTVFLIDYLKEFFEVEVILDESYLGKSHPDLSFIDESYLGVVFFQIMPTKEILENIKNDNVIYFPMYDHSGKLDYDFWHDYNNLKIINFSKTLHNKLMGWNFESMYIQYFPKLQDFIPGKKDEVFFWQRLTKININLLGKVLSNQKVRMHIHKAIDPYNKFIKPTKNQEIKFDITYSEWFETREEMWNLIKEKSVYVAPREYEGIGMSFLEAMSMGKAVIAVDNPTMNEYIKHGENGYLFDLRNPKEIDLSKVGEVQKNTYKYMQEGCERWNKDKEKIIKFIKSE